MAVAPTRQTGTTPQVTRAASVAQRRHARAPRGAGQGKGTGGHLSANVNAPHTAPHPHARPPVVSLFQSRPHTSPSPPPRPCVRCSPARASSQPPCSSAKCRFSDVLLEPLSRPAAGSFISGPETVGRGRRARSAATASGAALLPATPPSFAASWVAVTAAAQLRRAAPVAAALADWQFLDPDDAGKRSLACRHARGDSKLVRPGLFARCAAAFPARQRPFSILGFRDSAATLPVRASRGALHCTRSRENTNVARPQPKPDPYSMRARPTNSRRIQMRSLLLSEVRTAAKAKPTTSVV